MRPGQPITWPVTPYYRPETARSTSRPGSATRRRRDDAARNPHVSLLFSDPTGSRLERPVRRARAGHRARSTTRTSSRTASATRARAARSCRPRRACTRPPSCAGGSAGTTCASTSTCARSGCSSGPAATSPQEPTLYDARVDEVRTQHSVEPEVPLPPARGRFAGLGRPHGRAGTPPPHGRAVARRARRLPAVEPGADRARPRRRAGAAGRAAGVVAGGRRRGSASPRTSTTRSSSGRPTSRCAATSCARTAAGRSSPTSSWAASSCRSRSWRPSARTSEADALPQEGEGRAGQTAVQHGVAGSQLTRTTARSRASGRPGCRGPSARA